MERESKPARLRRLLCGAVLATMLVSSVAQAASSGKANDDRVNVRKSASTESDVLTQLRKGDTVRIEGTQDDWYKVSIDGKNGYVKKEYISADSASSGSSASGTAKTKDRVNLRKTASTDADSLAVLESGTSVTLKEKSGEWYKVSYDGKTGFIRGDFLDKAPQAEAANAPASGGETAEKSGSAITTDQVNLREKATTDSKSLQMVANGTTVAVQGTQGEWTKVQLGDKTGYIRSDFLSMDTSAPVVDGLTVGSKGSKVKTLQEALYITGYYTGNKDGNFGEETRAAVAKFQAEKGMEANGIANVAVTDELYLAAEMSKAAAEIAQNTGADEPVATAAPTEAVVSSVATASGDVLALPWSEVKGIIPQHQALTVLDIGTGKTYQISCFSAGNHADVEPLTKADTQTLKSIYGSWSWDPRPVWVTWNGQTYAAAINGMPHGGETISDNGMSGQICLHFQGSKTHNGNSSYERTFQNAVQKAIDAAK